MKSLLFIAMILSLVACGRTHRYQVLSGSVTTVNTVSTVTTTSTATDTIQSLVDRENQYRIGVGASPLTKGLSCYLSTVPANTPQIVGAPLTYVAGWTYYSTFNVPNGPVSDGFNVLPTALQTLYYSWYVVRCSGQLVVVNDDYYNFYLASDDGGILNIDGMSLNNDGNHGVTSKSGMAFLRAGVHGFDLYFMQGPAGYQALIVNMNGVPVPSANLYH